MKYVCQITLPQTPPIQGGELEPINEDSSPLMGED
jgi:hypothetical protein